MKLNFDKFKNYSSLIAIGLFLSVFLLVFFSIIKPFASYIGMFGKNIQYKPNMVYSSVFKEN